MQQDQKFKVTLNSTISFKPPELYETLPPQKLNFKIKINNDKLVELAVIDFSVAIT